MTINCIWYQDSFSGMLSTPSLPLLPGSLWPWLVVLLNVLFMGQIALFQNHLYLIESYAKKKKKEEKANLLRNNDTKNVNMNIKWMWFPYQ